ncbi:oxygen-independent coproporphyrinogen III oxidase [Sphingomonas sp. HDW15A]|nr:oxygen-independent coproporphyrinogen III oxidase [Sphingomonas sp. HDW15A]QIK97156.1 oxygen-independent coproporphyrinogen III oxidase [Sphingomonas sp. HDW15A]
MWKFLPELLATPVPRYTSYPTAAEFHEGIGESEQCAGLKGVGAEEEISLYLHIPYCREICWYCGCNTGAANKSQRLANYLERLTQEIDLVAAGLDGRGRAVRVSFGGGSPNAIAPEQFLALMDHLKSAFALPSSTEISVEIDPRGFDEAFAEALAGAGVTRASLGVQTFSPEIQAAIGRIQPRHAIERSVSLLRSAGITSLNFDLMYGLPRQDEAALVESIEESHDFGADRLAVFGYAHVPHMVPRQRRIDTESLPDAPLRFRQANTAYDWLVSRGWKAVGFDHFARSHDPLSLAAREGRVRRNFQGFTDDRCDTLIGLGASAISRFPGALVQNERNSGRYSMKVGLGRLAGAKGVATPPSERLRGRLIEELLCQGSTDIGKMPERLTVRYRLRDFEASRLIRWTDWRLELLEGAIPYARSVAAALDPWRKQSTKQFSTAV